MHGELLFFQEVLVMQRRVVDELRNATKIQPNEASTDTHGEGVFGDLLEVGGLQGGSKGVVLRDWSLNHHLPVSIGEELLHVSLRHLTEHLLQTSEVDGGWVRVASRKPLMRNEVNTIRRTWSHEKAHFVELPVRDHAFHVQESVHGDATHGKHLVKSCINDVQRDSATRAATRLTPLCAAVLRNRLQLSHDVALCSCIGNHWILEQT
mmetsp:Transcript_58428/g.155446  ORF Transcript_58428/g.155446 Transcript_58428/m.155446 type:complete len:208 (-) Transcript_58428:2-625(-)